MSPALSPSSASSHLLLPLPPPPPQWEFGRSLPSPPPFFGSGLAANFPPRTRHYLQSPYYFMCCSLYDATDDRPVPVVPSTALAGTLVSSLHRLKDVDNSGKLGSSHAIPAIPLSPGTKSSPTDGGFFVFGDLSVKIEGEFRLKFTMFEMRK